MNQLPLFQASSQALLDDASGVITYEPAVVDAATAQAWFVQLHRDIDWESHRRVMYERQVDVPRLRANFREGDALPAALREAATLVRQLVSIPFNSYGLNLYRDRHDSVAPHNDKLGTLVRGAPIALLSLGATRQMIIRQKKPPHLRLSLELQAGSLLVMSWDTQLHYDHGIPKQRHAVAPRISIACRLRAPDPAAG